MRKRDNATSGSVFIGSAAGMKNTTGFSNTFLGDNAGRDNTTASLNTMLAVLRGR
jgi:hypothetical protein